MSELALVTIQLVPALIPSRLLFIIIYHSIDSSLNKRPTRAVIKAYGYVFLRALLLLYFYSRKSWLF